MNDPENEAVKAEDRFARQLEKKHEQLIAAENDDSNIAADNEKDDERVQSALLILQLLEQFKSNPLDPPPENQAAAETRNDPSTQEPLRGLKSCAKAASIEHLVPDLQRLGRFEILEQIGRGGFGIVVRARDPQLDRDVAIKIPRFEAALSPESRSRFEREAKAAAALNHPGIVHVFETGCEQGIDFIVCELIEGENLATYLARGNVFSSKESARLVARIADAMEHAHQRNVFHRDIKPGNVLLRCDDSAQEPLIADFGLATMTGQDDLTQTGAVVGTPAYMSPEQAAGNKQRFGAATDVYGLGAILYQLIASQPPFGELPIVEMLDAINRREPESPRTLNRSVPKDLEAICLKCLEKKPERRYQSAQELQSDLQRFINDTPVIARRITPQDRSLRWLRRNPVLATVGTSAMVFLVATLIASVWGWSSTSAALQRESLAKDDARQTVNRYFTDVAENELLDVPGMLPLRKKLLTSALEYYQTFVATGESESDVVEELELAHLRLGKIQNELGYFSEAIKSLETALDLQDLILANNDSSSLLSRKFDTLRSIGQIQIGLDNFEVAMETIDAAIDGQRKLVESEPNQSDLQYELSRSLRAKTNLLADTGKFDEAIRLGDEAIELLVSLTATAPDNQSFLRDLAGSYLTQANSVAKTGKIDESVASVDLAIEIFRNFVESASPTLKDMHALASALRNRAGKHLAKQEFETSRLLLEEAVELNDHLVMMFPNAVEYRQQKLGLMAGLGYCYSGLQLTDKVIEVLGASIETLKHLKEEFTDNPEIEYELGVAQMNLGSTLAQQTEKINDAKTLLIEAEENLASFVARSPDFFQGKMATAFCQKNLAAICNQLQDHELALKYADRSIELLEAINTSKPGVPQVVQSIGGAYHNRADALDHLKQWGQSIPVWKTAVAHGGPLKVQSELRLASAFARSNQFDESIKILEALENEPSTLERDSGHLSRAQATIALAMSSSGDVGPVQVESLESRSVESFQVWIQSQKKPDLSAVRKMLTSEVYELLLQRDDFRQLLELDAAQTH